METLAGLTLPCGGLSGSSFDEALTQNGSICLQSFSLARYPDGILITLQTFLCFLDMNLLSVHRSTSHRLLFRVHVFFLSIFLSFRLFSLPLNELFFTERKKKERKRNCAVKTRDETTCRTLTVFPGDVSEIRTAWMCACRCFRCSFSL